MMEEFKIIDMYETAKRQAKYCGGELEVDFAGRIFIFKIKGNTVISLSSFNRMCAYIEGYCDAVSDKKGGL